MEVLSLRRLEEGIKDGTRCSGSWNCSGVEGFSGGDVQTSGRRPWPTMVGCRFGGPRRSSGKGGRTRRSGDGPSPSRFKPPLDLGYLSAGRDMREAGTWAWNRWQPRGGDEMTTVPRLPRLAFMGLQFKLQPIRVIPGKSPRPRSKLNKPSMPHLCIKM